MARYEREGRGYGSRGGRGDRLEGSRFDQGRDAYRGDDFGYGDEYSGQYDSDFRDNEDGYYGGTRGYQQGRGGYGDSGRDPGRYGGYGMVNDDGYGGRRDLEGWQDQRGGMGSGTGRQRNSIWNRPRAAEIMTENPHVVTPDASIGDVAMKMRDLDVGIIPVVDDMEGRRLRGVITDRDITIRGVAMGMGADARVADCMTEGVRAVNKNDSIQDVMWVMRREQVRRVPVTDREGRLVGIIAQADLAVDYAADDDIRETEVGETLERISEPARPDRMRSSASGRTSDADSGRGTSTGARRGSRSRKSKEEN